MGNNSAYKGYYGIMKGIVTRTDDPKELENNNRRRIQVCIPSYHGSPYIDEENKILDESKTKGGVDDEGLFPWAQVCSNMFNSNSSNNSNSSGNVSFIGSLLSSLFGQTSNTTSASPLEMLYPSVGDIVWLMFEGGDIRCPVYVGALSALINTNSTATGDSVLYTNDGRSLAKVIIDMIKTIVGLDYGSISNID